MKGKSVLSLSLRAVLVGMVLSVAAAPALAGGGNVMPPKANQKGYSLTDLAAATALFNTGQVTGNPKTPAEPNIPFKVLVGDATVAPGTMLYVPLYFADDSAPIIPPFPKDVTNHASIAAYLDKLLADAFGVQSLFLQVDGQITVLSDDYITGVTTPPLLDAAPADAGTHYIVSAAVLSPLTPGTHNVSIGGMIAGKPVVFLSYTVTVK